MTQDKDNDVSKADLLSQLGQDLRFYADQRFRIVGVFMLTTGFLANVAKDRQSMVLAFIGLCLTYLCWSWEERTLQWWGQLYEAFKGMVPDWNGASVYSGYPGTPPRPYVKATTAVRGIYAIGGFGWIAFAWYSYPRWW